MQNLVIENWKNYVVDGTNLQDLENDLNKNGFLDENGSLILIEDGVDYKKKFWQRYDRVFDDKVLGAEE